MVKALLINITYQYTVLMGRKRKIHYLKLVVYSIILILCLYLTLYLIALTLTLWGNSFSEHISTSRWSQTLRATLRCHEERYKLYRNTITRLIKSILMRESYPSVRKISIRYCREITQRRESGWVDSVYRQWIPCWHAKDTGWWRKFSNWK